MTLATRFWTKVDRRGDRDCWLWLGARRPKGYGLIGRGGRGGGTDGAHRVSYELHHGAILTGAHVLHRCDNPPCVNPAHLFLGTPKANAVDKMAKGRQRPGEQHPRALLTEADVIEMRQMWAHGGITQDRLAERFGTTKANVSRIVRGEKWCHLLPSDWTPPTPGRWSRHDRSHSDDGRATAVHRRDDPIPSAGTDRSSH